MPASEKKWQIFVFKSWQNLTVKQTPTLWEFCSACFQFACVYFLIDLPSKTCFLISLRGKVLRLFLIVWGLVVERNWEWFIWKASSVPTILVGTEIMCARTRPGCCWKVCFINNCHSGLERVKAHKGVKKLPTSSSDLRNPLRWKVNKTCHEDLKIPVKLFFTVYLTFIMGHKSFHGRAANALKL